MLISNQLSEQQNRLFFKSHIPLKIKGEIEGEPVFRFVSFSDSHYGINDSSRGNDGLYQNRMQLIIDNIVAEREGKGLDFVLANGDIVHSSSADFPNSEAMMIEVINDYFSQLNLPIYSTAGNHDWINTDKWNDLFGHHRSHAFEHKDFGFIVADSSDLTGARQICIDEGFVEDKVIEYADKKGIFFVSHIPRFSGGFSTPDRDSPDCDRINTALENADNVILSTHGHFHHEDNKINRNVPAFFEGHISDYGVNYYGYRVYEVFEDRVKTYMWDMTNQRIVNEHTINF